MEEEEDVAGPVVVEGEEALCPDVLFCNITLFQLISPSFID